MKTEQETLNIKVAHSKFYEPNFGDFLSSQSSKFFEIIPTIYITSQYQGFCVAEFATLSDERSSRSYIFLLFNMYKRTLRSKI